MPTPTSRNKFCPVWGDFAPIENAWSITIASEMISLLSSKPHPPPLAFHPPRFYKTQDGMCSAGHPLPLRRCSNFFTWPPALNPAPSPSRGHHPCFPSFGSSGRLAVPQICGCSQTPLLRDALCLHRPIPRLHFNVSSHVKTRAEGFHKDDALSHPQGTGHESLIPAGPGQPPMTEPTALC